MIMRILVRFSFLMLFALQLVACAPTNVASFQIKDAYFNNNQVDIEIRYNEPIMILCQWKLLEFLPADKVQSTFLKQTIISNDQTSLTSSTHEGTFTDSQLVWCHISLSTPLNGQPDTVFTVSSINKQPTNDNKSIGMHVSVKNNVPMYLDQNKCKWTMVSNDKILYILADYSVNVSDNEVVVHFSIDEPEKLSSEQNISLLCTIDAYESLH